MARNKISEDDVKRLKAFGVEMEKRMEGLDIYGPTGLSRKANNKISVTYISDILRAARGNSDKYFRLSREKVELIAAALNWDRDDALDLAGYSQTAKSQSATDDLIIEPVEQALRRAHTFEGRGLSESEIKQLRPLMEILDREIDRLAGMNR